MAQYITFPNARVQSFSRNLTGGKISITCNLGSNVCKGMAWRQPVDMEKSTALEGELHATSMLLTPKDKELAKFELDLEIDAVKAFKQTRKEIDGSRGKGHRHDLTFEISFSAPEVAAKLEFFMLNCGGAKCSCKVSYNQQPKQVATEDGEDDKQATIELPAQPDEDEND